MGKPKGFDRNKDISMKQQMHAQKEDDGSSMSVGFSSLKFYDHRICVAIVVLLAAGAGLWATPYMGFATLAYGFMNIGLMNRRHRSIHASYMLSAIALDLALVLTLELQRDAIKTAMSFSLSPLQQAHILMSSLATALYIPIVILGYRLYFGRLNALGRLWHRRLGIAGYVFRSLGFLLMFSLLMKK